MRGRKPKISECEGFVTPSAVVSATEDNLKHKDDRIKAKSSGEGRKRTGETGDSCMFAPSSCSYECPASFSP